MKGKKFRKRVEPTWVLLPFLLACLDQRLDVVPHLVHLGPPAWTGAVSNVVVTPADQSTSSTRLSEIVVVRVKVLGIAMADEHKSLGI